MGNGRNGGEKPLISVVIPVYNVRSYLEACVESVLCQTYRNLQIVLVDDGSTDGSGGICDRYAKADGRVSVIHQKNGGLSAARNAGIGYSSGAFITFVDSDDILLPDAIEYLYGLSEATGANMSVCQRALIDENGAALPERGRYKNRSFRGNGRCMAGHFRAKEFHGAAWGKLYRRWLFNALRFPEGKCCEDVFVAYMVAANCQTIAIGREKKYLYRMRKNSIIHGEFSQRYLDAVEGALLQLDFVENLYPRLINDAKADVVRAADLCVLKMIESAKPIEKEGEILALLQAYYRRYLWQFLFGKKAGLRAKAFAVPASFRLEKAVQIARKLYKKNGGGGKKQLAPQE